MLLDPTALDPEGLTTLDSWVPDLEGRQLAYQLSHGGDEHSVLHVLDVDTGADVEPPIDRCRYSDVSWLPGGAELIFVRMVDEHEVPDGEQSFHRRIWRHRIGTPTDQDVLVKGPGLYEEHTYYGVSVSRDGRWLLVTGNVGTARRDSVWIADLAAGSALLPLLTQADDVQCHPWVDRDGRLYLHTTDGAPRWRLAVAEPTRPGREHWRELVAEDPDSVLQAVRRLRTGRRGHRGRVAGAGPGPARGCRGGAARGRRRRPAGHRAAARTRHADRADRGRPGHPGAGRPGLAGLDRLHHPAPGAPLRAGHRHDRAGSDRPRGARRAAGALRAARAHLGRRHHGAHVRDHPGRRRSGRGRPWSTATAGSGSA